MSNFTRTTTHEIEFDGDKVTVELERPKRGDLLGLAPYMKQDDKGQMVLSFSDIGAMLGTALDILPSRVKRFSGLFVDGKEAAFADIVDEAYFMDLVGTIFQRFAESAAVADPKEQAVSSPAISPASADEAASS